MKIKKQIMAKILRSKCNTDNFNLSGVCISAGFTQEYHWNQYYIDIYDLGDGWIKVSWHKYGQSMFENKDTYICKKRDLYKIQKAYINVGVYLSHSDLKRFIYDM